MRRRPTSTTGATAEALALAAALAAIPSSPAVAAAGLPFAGPVAAGPAEDASAPIDLPLGGAAFWDGPTIASGDVPDPSLCGTVAPCPTYRLRLADIWPRNVWPGARPHPSG